MSSIVILSVYHFLYGSGLHSEQWLLVSDLSWSWEFVSTVQKRYRQSSHWWQRRDDQTSEVQWSPSGSFSSLCEERHSLSWTSSVREWCKSFQCLRDRASSCRDALAASHTAEHKAHHGRRLFILHNFICLVHLSKKMEEWKIWFSYENACRTNLNNENSNYRSTRWRCITDAGHSIA